MALIGHNTDFIAKKLKRDAIRNLYNTMFSVFQKGIDGNGRPLFVIDGEVRQPRYPLGHSNEFILSASETMDSILAKMLGLYFGNLQNHARGTD